jgi:hypothetical protein
MFIFCARDLRPSSLFALGRAGEKQKFLSLLSASNFFSPFPKKKKIEQYGGRGARSVRWLQSKTDTGSVVRTVYG